MDAFSKPRTWIVLGVVAASLFLLYQFWVWEVERVEVPPGEFLVVTSLWGKELPSGEVVAPNESYKGIQLRTRPDGRHFINPVLYTYERHKVVVVPAGQCLVLTRKYGNVIDAEKLQRGEVLVEGNEKPLKWDPQTQSWNGERGIIREPLGPGNYYLNPLAYDWTLHPQVSIHPQQVGVCVLKAGKDPANLDKNQRTSPYLVPEGYRGVQEKPVAPADYPVNPFAKSIIPVDVRSTTVTLTDIVFPSKDGFALSPVVVVQYSVQPEMAPQLLVTLTDKGALYQKSDTPAEQEQNQILQKVVLPLIRGSVRMEGSKFNARDFIAAQEKEPGAKETLNPLEELQNKLNEQIPKKCKAEGINIKMITIDTFTIHEDLTKLATQINERKQARLELVSNQSKIKEYKAKQKLEADSEALTQQKAKVVEAETELKKATITATQRKAVEESKLKNDLKVAENRLAAAKDKAQAITSKGEAEARKITLENEATVAGLKKAISGFPGPDAYAQFQIMAKVGPALTEIFATDSSDFAKLFAGYLTGHGPKPTSSTSSGPMGNGASGR